MCQQYGDIRSVILLIGCLLCSPLHAGVRVVIFFFISFFGGWPFLSTVLPLCFHLRSHLGKSIPHYASEWNDHYCLFGFLLRSPLHKTLQSLRSQTLSPLIRWVLWSAVCDNADDEFSHDASVGLDEEFERTSEPGSKPLYGCIHIWSV